MSANASSHRPLPKHEFVAGRMSLDFCNTLSRTPQETDWDRVETPGDFLEWARRCGLDVERAPAPPALARLHALRRALADTFDAVVDERPPSARDLAVLNAELSDARTSERLMPTDHGYALADGASAPIDRFRHALVCEAADLLTSDPRRIKRCPDHDCRWLFYDGSRNLSRRWCAMDDCGARDKVRRFRERGAES